MAIESSDWYIENVHTKNINLLNKGEFSIGRREDNNLIIDGRFMKHCSRKHCIITLKDDTVRILNTSQYGTYINASEKVEKDKEKQIYNGDVISLVDREKILDSNCRDYDFLSFVLRHIQSDEPMSQSDDEASGGQVVVSATSCGEILVSTNTISIDLTKDSDSEGDHEDYGLRFADDYEVGEPSSKNIDDSDTESKPKPTPTPKPTQKPKRSNDPVDKALEKLNARIAAQEAKRRAIVEDRNTPMEPVVQKVDVAAKPAAVVEVKKQSDEKNKFAVTPFKDRRHRIAHVPKDHQHPIMAPSPSVQPPSPPNDPKKRGTKRTASPPVHQNKRANIIIDSILTPPSGESSPAQQIVVPENHAAALTRTIVAWNAANMMNKINGKCPQRFIVRPPEYNFGDFNNHESVQTNILKCNLWNYLHQKLRPLPDKPILRLLTKKPITVTGHLPRLIYSCQAPCNLNLQYGVVLVVNATVSSGSMNCQFLGFIIDRPQKIDKDNMCAFELEIVPGLADNWNVNPKATIVAYHTTNDYVMLYETIFKARESNLFEAIINPQKLRDFTKQNHLDRTKCIHRELDASQYEAIERIFNNTLDALQRGNAFAMAINGGPGSGKSSVLLEALIALVRRDTVKEKKFKILVTGNSDDTVDSLALKLHKIRSYDPNIPTDLFPKLNFVRYRNGNNVQYHDVRRYVASEYAKLPNGTIDSQKYRHILRTANIVFAPVKVLQNLSVYCDKFDVILFDNASEVDEISSTLPFILSPSSFIMFGDRFRSPKDPMDLMVKYRTQNLNQSMFGRLVNGTRCVVNLRYTHRFGTSVLKFLNHMFYKGSLNRLYQKPDGFKGFGLFHRSNDSCMFQLLEQFMQFASPEVHQYAIILPPNIKQPSMDQTLGRYKPRVMLSKNLQFTIEEKDIVIIWVNESSKTESQYRIANMWNVLTRAKKAVYFVGCTAMLCKDENWREVYDFARRSNSEFNLNGREVSISDIENYMGK